MILKSKRIMLRPMDKNDIELLRLWRNKHSEDFFTHDYITKEQQRAWYHSYIEREGTDHVFMILLNSGGTIGTISLYNVDIGTRTAEVGRLLVIEEYQRQGYMDEALKLILELAFETMKLYKLKLGVYLDNVQAISIYANVGFTTTARPVILMEKINPNYDNKKPITLESYDDLSENGYESTGTNLR